MKDPHAASTSDAEGLIYHEQSLQDRYKQLTIAFDIRQQKLDALEKQVEFLKESNKRIHIAAEKYCEALEEIIKEAQEVMRP